MGIVRVLLKANKWKLEEDGGYWEQSTWRLDTDDQEDDMVRFTIDDTLYRVHGPSLLKALRAMSISDV